ncbi:SCO family protein [Effusibacillus consociatus]|uniref:SCO family protein n=1 Tax=Effusibacillus consociatus TaxID=1117041 RepID=A0ABV9Q1F1_9BACL
MNISTNRTTKNGLFVLATLVLAGSLAACGGASQGGTPPAPVPKTETPQPANKLPVQGQISNFTLENTEKKPVSLDNDLKAKAKLVYFFYTNCHDVCPITTKRMETILGKLKQQVPNADIQLISITVDPNRDTADVLKQYAKQFNADPNTWAFLRGTKEQTDAVMKQFHVSAEEMMNHDIMHSDRLFLLDEKNQWRNSYLMGTGVKDEEIIADIKTLLAE